MIRNKKLLQMGMALLVFNGILLVTYKEEYGRMYLLICGLGNALLCLFYTKQRYQDIKKLNSYLQQIYHHEEVMDIRDNEEGELSILKNDLYKMTFTLKEQAELLKKDKLYLADALSNISHQLKTPLTSMFVMNDLLKQEGLSVEKKELFLKTSTSQLERIEWLVSSLLKLSKIDADAIAFKEEEIIIETLLHSAIEPIAIPAELKRQKMVMKGDLDACVIGDFQWIREAILNVLKNCVEHTKEGGTITIEVIQNPIYVSIRIQDEGNGIAQEDLPHIFERFYKGKNRSSESVGIGLAMAKTILQQNQGEIQVLTTSEKGTLFQIRFFHTKVK